MSNNARENTYRAINSLRESFLKDYVVDFSQFDALIEDRSKKGWMYCCLQYPLQVWTPVLLHDFRWHYEPEGMEVCFEDGVDDNGVEVVRVTIRW